MIGPIVRDLLLQNQETFLIPAENVANVMYQHPLSHGLLVLSKVGYTKIPVLGKDDRFVGLVSLSDVVNKMIDLQTISMDPLEVFKGIITRKELLKAVNYMVHELERRNIVSPKVEELKEKINIVS